jgi:hypothetical protein
VKKIMKKVLFLVVAALFVFGIQHLALASFTSLGWVSPNFGNSFQESSATGIARYYFYWDYAPVTVNQLDLEFEGDIFDLAALDTSDFTMVIPSGWTTSIWQESPGVYHWSFSSGAGINSTEDPIILDVNYKLLSSARYYYGNNEAAGDVNEWGWLESQGANTPWSQKYELRETITIPINGTLRTVTLDSSGGSTAPIPEPASLMLLGAGMGILGLLKLRKKA